MLTRYTIMVFGKEDALYWQAHWLILSLLAHADQPFEIAIATDHPRHFNWFGDAVRVHGMSEQDVSAWIGPEGHFFRALIKTLEFGLELQPTADAVFYLDSDMALNRSLAPVIAGIQAGAIYMDRYEYNLFTSGRKGNKGARKLWAQVGDRDWSGITIDRQTPMWNTGITGLSVANINLVKKSLAVCDAILATGVLHRLTEQIAMSAAMTANNRELLEVNPEGQEPYFTHYWANKRGWREAITGHLATIHHRGLSVPEAVQYFLENPIDRPAKVNRTRKWHRFLGVQPVR
jgi:hypothetical protein